MRYWMLLPLLALAGCETLSVPKMSDTPTRITNLTPSTFCRQMTVLDPGGQKQCRLSYVPQDTPRTAMQIEEVCARWEASCPKGK